MEVRAELNYLRMSPRKVRLVASVMKGMDARRAELELRHLPKRAARPLAKLLASAIANAKHNFELAAEDLIVHSIVVNEGPTLKRMMPRAMGRGAAIRKRMSHVRLILATKGGGGAHTDALRALGGRQDSAHAPNVSREAAPDEIKTGSGAAPRRSRDDASLSKKSAKAAGGFTRRMFQRKAI